MGTRSRIDEIYCNHCGKHGRLYWENDPHATRQVLVRIDGDFYERIRKKAPYPIELVCNGCGAAQQELEQL